MLRQKGKDSYFQMSPKGDNDQGAFFDIPSISPSTILPTNKKACSRCLPKQA
jgi:hypothetical protein